MSDGPWGAKPPANSSLERSDTLRRDIVDRGAVVDHLDFRSAIRRNQERSLALFCLLFIIAALPGYALGWAFEMLFSVDAGYLANSAEFRWDRVPLVSAGGFVGMGILLAVSAVWSIVAVFFGDKIMLAMVGARPADRKTDLRLFNVVEEMAIASGLPPPRVGVLESPALNVFAAGLKPDHATICVTRGLIDGCSRDELQGVVAHEMGHILNGDMRYATFVGVMVGLIALVSDAILRSFRIGRRYRYVAASGRGRRGNPLMLVALVVIVAVAILAPLSAKLVQMAISRQREFLADATAVRLTRNPAGLIGALDRIANADHRFADANRSVQHLFIANPFRDFSAHASALLATHPPLADRIERLQAMGG